MPACHLTTTSLRVSKYHLRSWALRANVTCKVSDKFDKDLIYLKFLEKSEKF